MGWCLVSGLVFVASIAGGPQRSPLRFDELHHEYVGLAVCAVGQVAHSRLILRVGRVLAADDATQHVYQRMNDDLGIRSPINIGYRFTAGQLPIFNQLNGWLDRVLH